MARNGWFSRRRFAFHAALLGGIGLASCTSSPGGIVVETDGAGGAGGAKDGASDSRESGGVGGAGAAPDSAADVLSDVAEDLGDSGPPPMCVYYTPPPPMLSLFDDSGADAASDGGSDAMMDAVPADATGMDIGNVDLVVVPDSAGEDATIDTLVDGPGPTPIDVVNDTTVVDASGDRSGGGRDGGSTGDAGPAPSITVLNSPFLGPYLADSAGRTLYTFGNDKPGDCTYPPIPDCEADCLIAWPAFDAGKRTLATSLNPAVFGSVSRTDGLGQITTYYGWPLYYYRSDTAGGLINGQGKSKTWHVATVSPHNMMIMRDNTNPRYIADGDGRTLYVFAQDTVGTPGSDPISTCVGDCLLQYPPFQRNGINAVSSLAPNDLSLFVRPDTRRQQVAYKGAPLYLSAADMRSGDQKGVAMGWAVAAAP
jgi:predicted lipoprotein with Yx(FWY)xxD motif